MENKAVTLEITDPSGESPLIDFGRHFAVEGRISGALPPDASLEVRLIDENGKTVRRVRAAKKGMDNLYPDHPALTKYPPHMDSDLSLLKKFGFPPLAVTDTGTPESSLRDSTIKCQFCDSNFKCIIVSATDTAHGLLLPDGMEYTDENGNPLTAFPRGKYTVTVTLFDKNGISASTGKQITVGDKKNQIICRFNPREHKARMIEWCRENDFSVITDLMPGYLESYMGTWLYHMGLLKMYRACDVAMYLHPAIHMFIYNITPDSTSYETEIGFLQTHGRISGDVFHAYCYDIGEAALGEKSGKIEEFSDGEFLKICRVDSVDTAAKENVFDLSGKGVRRFCTDFSNVPANSRFAVTGVIRPWQMNAEDFILRDDNTYEIKNRPEALVYTFEWDENRETHTKRPGMERICGDSIGTSVFEFYNIFDFGEKFSGKRVKVTVRVLDSRLLPTPACKSFYVSFE